jgi:UDP-N-acetylglucosamine acyltransferase
MIHPTALVHETANIHENVTIGPYCVVGAEAEIGTGTRLMERVSVGPKTCLGSENVVYPGCVIGGDPQDLSFRFDDEMKVSCRIGDRNVFRECVTVNRGTLKDLGETRIGHDNLMMACCHVAHDCVIQNHTVIANGVLLAGHVTVEDHVVFSGMTGAAQFVTVGRLSYIAGMTALSQDVPPFVKVQGGVGEVRGLNTLGLKRAGLDHRALVALREAYRIIWMSDLTLKEAIVEIYNLEDKTDEVNELVGFLQKKSEGRFGRARENSRTW